MRTTLLRSELFSVWEKRLRGWDVYGHTIELEPNFIRCPKDQAYSMQAPAYDDAKHETFLSNLADKFTGKTQAIPEQKEEQEILFPECEANYHVHDIIELHLLLPQDFKTHQSLMQHIIKTLTFVRHPLCFEVIGTEGQIIVALSCAKEDAPQVYDQLTAHSPECVIDETKDYLTHHFDQTGIKRAVDFGLEYEVMRPLLSNIQNHDALIGIMGALSRLGEEECGVLQILFQPTKHRWSDALRDAVTNYDGTAFFADAPEMLPLTKQKTDSPLCSAVIRVAARAKTKKRANDMNRAIGGALMQLHDPNSNSLMPLSNEHYSDDEHVVDVLQRTTRRSGMLLNLDEITALAHLPDASVRVPKLKRATKRTKASPVLTTGNEFHLGINPHHGHQTPVTLDADRRLRHMYLIGASGTGKSTMLMNMIIQDMEAGNGIAVLDPHGDLIDTILGYVPEERIDDVIVFDPSDEAFPIGFNILDAKSELEKTLLASDLVSVFRRLSTSWGDQMNSVLANGISAMLESTEGGTLPILRRFLVDKSFRTEFLKTVQDPENVFYWEREFPLLSGKPQAPVLTRLDTFLRPKPIRHMVAQKDNKIDFANIMQKKKIFLAKLSQGAIGNENSYLMGAFLVTKLNQIAFSRQALKKAQRNDFYLYVDEFHNFITPSMESILSGTRKYHMGLILAHQELRQLESRDADVAASVRSNPDTRVCFRLGDTDAKRLQNGFSYFDAQDLQSLDVGEAIARVQQAQYDFNLSTPPLPPIDEAFAEQKANAIIKQSQQRYGSPKEEVEDLLYESIGMKPEKKLTAYLSEKQVESESLRGRGGVEHKHLQRKIKQLAEAVGFKAIVEQQINDGTGHVDVALEKEDLSIACEISITTSPKHEVGNIQKCLDAGFDQVLCVSPDKIGLGALEKVVNAKLSDHKDKVIFALPEDIEKVLSEYADGTERIHGYVVETEYAELSANEKKQKIKRIARVLSDSVLEK